MLPDLSSELLALQQAPTTAPLALTHPGVEQDFLPGGSATSNAITRHGGTSPPQQADDDQAPLLGRVACQSTYFVAEVLQRAVAEILAIACASAVASRGGADARRRSHLAWRQICSVMMCRTAAGHKSKRTVALRKVVVDVREFMSSLPATLYSQGLEILPLTLEVCPRVLLPDRAHAHGACMAARVSHRQMPWMCCTSHKPTCDGHRGHQCLI